MPVMILVLGGAFALGALLLAREFLLADAYFLARAHLYGNQVHHCAPSKLWPSLPSFSLRFDCSGSGRVNAELKRADIPVLKYQVDLETGQLNERKL